MKLRNDERRLTVMVISKDAGAYSADRLPPGDWKVQAVGGDIESTWSQPVSLTNAGTGETNIAMTEFRKPDLAPAWPRRMPEELASIDSLPNGHGKDIIQKSCVSCHDAARIAANRDDREGWRNLIDGMRVNMKNAGLPPMSDEDAAALLDYAAENMPPMGEPDPNSRLPRELVEGEARNYRVVEYDLENEGAEPHDVAVDPNGIGWANQRFGGKVSRFDPVTYEYSEIGPPMTYAPKARPGNLQISADGMMWLPDPNERRWLSYDRSRASGRRGRSLKPSAASRTATASRSPPTVRSGRPAPALRAASIPRRRSGSPGIRPLGPRRRRTRAAMGSPSTVTDARGWR